jgi:FkbM family methyltransferase
VYRTEGAKSFVWKLLQYLKKRLLFLIGRIYTSFVPPLPSLVATQTIGDVTAKFHVATNEEWPRAFGGGEPQLVDFVERLEPDDVVFDVGANVGLYSLLAAETVTEGGVVAFEPHPQNAQRLEQNAELNGLDLRTLDVALSDQDGQTELSFPADIPGEGKATIANGHGGLPANKATTVETRRADGLVASGTVPQPTVIKIDVEGAEEAVINGMHDVLDAPACRLVYCEVHAPPDDPTDVAASLDKLGFEVTRIDERSSEYHLRARKR